MKFLRQFLDRLHPHFKEGGKLETLYPLYEAVDTFLYTPGERTHRASHVRDSMDLKRMMVTVIVALVPCIVMAFYNTGYQANLAIQQPGSGATAAPGWRGSAISALGGGTYDPGCLWCNLVHGAAYFIPVFLVCNIVGLGIEILFACMRRHDVNEGFLVTGMLFPLILPTIPLWQVAIGIAFGVVIGKEVFGGTGKNFLNPALVARAFLFFAYPAEITGDTVWTAVDGFSGATPLGALATANVETGMAAITGGPHGVTWMQAFLGTMQGSMGETSTLACLIGAAILIVTGVGSWRIMLSMLIGAMGLSGILYGMATGAAPGTFTNAMFFMPPWWHLVVGGFAFGLVFMATDPVSAAMTEPGKWVFGALIGVMTILIRVVNPAYPEGVMLAILFGNVFAPTIDYCVLQLNIRRRKARNARAA